MTPIIAGTRDAETKKKLLTINPFPSLQVAVNICRSEESARANEWTLSGQSGVAAIINKNCKSDHRHDCGAALLIHKERFVRQLASNATNVASRIIFPTMS